MSNITVYSTYELNSVINNYTTSNSFKDYYFNAANNGQLLQELLDLNYNLNLSLSRFKLSGNIGEFSFSIDKSTCSLPINLIICQFYLLIKHNVTVNVINQNSEF